MKTHSLKIFFGMNTVKYVIPAIQGGDIAIAKHIYPIPSLIYVQSTVALF